MKWQKADFILEIHPLGSLAVNAAFLINNRTNTAWIVDPTDDPDSVIRLIQERGLQLERLIGTHGHYDHLNGADELRKKLGAKILLHPEDLALYHYFFSQRYRYQYAQMEELIDGQLQDGATLDFGGLGIKVLHTPGHSQGSCGLYIDFFDQPILLSGDTIFCEAIGRTDFPGGSFAKIKNSIQTKIYTLPLNTIIVPGHGESTTVAHERVHNPYIQAATV